MLGRVSLAFGEHVRREFEHLFVLTRPKQKGRAEVAHNFPVRAGGSFRGVETQVYLIQVHAYFNLDGFLFLRASLFHGFFQPRLL